MYCSPPMHSTAMLPLVVPSLLHQLVPSVPLEDAPPAGLAPLRLLALPLPHHPREVYPRSAGRHRAVGRAQRGPGQDAPGRHRVVALAPGRAVGRLGGVLLLEEVSSF